MAGHSKFGKILAAVLLAVTTGGLLCAAPSTPEAPAAPKSQDPLHRETPRSAVYSFLQACHSRNYGQAARYIDLDQLCLSPQCGFASTEEGNILAEDEQWAKLRRIVEVADEVWG